MKKVIIIIAITLMSLVLCGCMAGVAEITINSDGTIEIVAQTGISEATINLMASTSEEVKSLKQQTKFVYNGVNYYGEIKNIEYKNIEEFNSSINETNEYGTDQGKIGLSQNQSGDYILTLIINQNTADTQELESNLEINGLNKSQIERLMKDMVMIYTFNMPGKVVQTLGSTKGITISENKLVIDYLKLDIPIQENGQEKYEFQVKMKAEENQRFIDVTKDMWSYNAINKLAEGGLVAGVGYGKFSPERGMKISEFCQVLANATKLESGEDENGYWAAKAIKSCIEKGYIYSHGDIIPENYEQTITRQEAIAAMQLASKRGAIVGKNMTIEDIPDGNKIDEKYKKTIVQAYNSGITTGVNDEFKFSPTNPLTREQVCQLFYNVNWTTKMQ